MDQGHKPDLYIFTSDSLIFPNHTVEICSICHDYRILKFCDSSSLLGRWLTIECSKRIVNHVFPLWQTKGWIQLASNFDPYQITPLCL